MFRDKYRRYIDMQFYLGDNARSFIKENITVRRIDGDFVGAEYCDDAYRHELDFYVMHATEYA
jgi:hypothetical protein